MHVTVAREQVARAHSHCLETSLSTQAGEDATRRCVQQTQTGTWMKSSELPWTTKLEWQQQATTDPPRRDQPCAGRKGRLTVPAPCGHCVGQATSRF